MRAVRIHRFGPPEVVVLDEVSKPSPASAEVLVRVVAAGVAPWDAIIREGKSAVSPPPPLTLGSDLSGFIEAVGPDVTTFKVGDEAYGVTNPQFCGAQAEFAVASAGMIAPKPQSLTHIQAASAPVVAVTAWQMLFQYALAKKSEVIMITGAAGNVGAYAVQMALNAGMRVVAVARPQEVELLHSLGVTAIIDSSADDFSPRLSSVDVLLDTVGGTIVQQCVEAVRPGGRLVSVVSANVPQRTNMQSTFFYAEVTSQRLLTLNSLFQTGAISTRVGSVLPLSEARQAHEMLAGASHRKGKIVLRV
jgi:NADPH:quinone reductase-like Zn-dependent oxidoreductase